MKWPQIVTPVRVPRRDRKFAKQVSAILPEAVRWNEAPTPVRYGDFWNVGKDPRHAWPHRYVFSTDNSASTNSIQQPLTDRGAQLFPTVPSAMVQRPPTFAPHQFQKPVQSPVGLLTPEPVSWGSQQTVRPLIGYSSAYAKLL